MIGSQFLTDPNFIHLATEPGQAHFASDTSHTCRECGHWANQRGERAKHGILKPARCRKALEHLRDPPPIPHSATNCRHFPGRRRSTGPIDLAIQLDEPEQAIRLLIEAANEWIDASENTEKWKATVAQLAVLQKQLRAIEQASVTQGC